MMQTYHKPLAADLQPAGHALAHRVTGCRLRRAGAGDLRNVQRRGTIQRFALVHVRQGQQPHFEDRGGRHVDV